MLGFSSPTYNHSVGCRARLNDPPRCFYDDSTTFFNILFGTMPVGRPLQNVSYGLCVVLEPFVGTDEQPVGAQRNQ